MDVTGGLQGWDDRENDQWKRCKTHLRAALFHPELRIMEQLFALQGFILGKNSGALHQIILRAYIDGETSLDHVRLFFSTLGGGFFTNTIQNWCVWTDIAWIEGRSSTFPKTLEAFKLQFFRIYNLVQCLVSQFGMPVNTVRKFNTLDPTTPLDFAQKNTAWMTYWSMASFCPGARQISLGALRGDSYLPREMVQFWTETVLLTNSGHIDTGRMRIVGEEMQRYDRADQEAKRRDYEVDLLSGGMHAASL